MTLYDIFGYLLPGTVALFAVVIVFCVLLLPPTPVPRELPGEMLAIFLFLGYVTGHTLQALCNVLRNTSQRAKEVTGTPPLLVAAVRAKLRTLRLDPGNDWKLLYDVCDEFVTQRGVRDNQEIYEYRRGFYRGMSLAFALLTISLGFWFFRPSAVQIPGLPSGPTPGMFLFVAVLTIATSVALYRRYRRFARYRVEAALTGFLALKPDDD